MTDLLQRVYAVFDPTAPVAAGAKDIYVELDKVRGNAGAVAKLARHIQLSRTNPTCQLLAGHRGCGKSTELRRLQAQLEDGPPPIFVVFVEALQDVDPNDVDFPEVLIAVVRQAAAQLQERANITLKPGYFKDRFAKLKDLGLREVTFDGLELGAGLAKISTSIKGSPDARSEVRKLLEPDTGNLLHAANDVLGKAKLELVKQGYKDLVIIVDDLDKMTGRPHESADCSTDEHLFVNRHAQLSGFDCHMVYSMPLALAYSTAGARLETLYGRRIPVIPMVKITTRPPRPKPHKPGLDCMRKLISSRLRKEGVTEKEVFADTKVRDELLRRCGGQPRELMILISEAIVGGGLPIKMPAVQRAVREGTRSYAQKLRAEHLAIIREVAKTGSLKRTKDNDGTIRDLLDSRAILQYVNHDEWYGVNPLIEIPAKARAKPSARRK